MCPNIEPLNNAPLRDILLSAKDGNEAAQRELYRRCEPLINKFSMRDGHLDPDLKSHLITDLLNVIQKFDPLRYYPEESEETDQP